MRKLLLILLATIGFNAITMAQSDEFLNDLINLWNNKKYDKVYLPLKEYKESKKISGDFEIDYMIATSASRSNAAPDKVKALFADLMASYTFKTVDEEYVSNQSTPAKYSPGKNPRMDNEYIANRGKVGDKTSADVPKPLGKIELQKIEAQKKAEEKKLQDKQLAEQKKAEALRIAELKKKEIEAKKAIAKAKQDSISNAKAKLAAAAKLANPDSTNAKTETQELKDYNTPTTTVATKETKTSPTDKKTAGTATQKPAIGKDGKPLPMNTAAAKDGKANSDIIRKPGVTQIVKGDRVITVKAGYTYMVRTDSIYEIPPPTAKKPMGAVTTPTKK
jgi:hypothetical protein